MPISGPDVVLCEKKEQILYITLNRAERMNAISGEAGQMMDEALERANNDDDIRVVVITGAGDKAFCVGMDLREASERMATTGSAFRDASAQGSLPAQVPSKDMMFGKITEVKKPIIAAVNGMCFAGGFLMAQNCDLRIGAEGASFSIREAKVGRGSPWAVPLLWMVPLSIALELTMLAEPISAERMYQVGFLNKVVPRDQLMPAAKAMAEILRDNAPLSVQAAKGSLHAAMDLGCAAGIDKALEIHIPVYTSEDAVEGPKAFAEKRKPVWKGR